MVYTYRNVSGSSSNPTVENCTFSGNMATLNGGGISDIMGTLDGEQMHPRRQQRF